MGLAEKFLKQRGKAVYLYWWWLPAFSGPQGHAQSEHGDDNEYLWLSEQVLKYTGKCNRKPLAHDLMVHSSQAARRRRSNTCKMAFNTQSEFASFINGDNPWEAFDPQQLNYQNLTIEPQMERQKGLSVCKWWWQYVSANQQNYRTFMAFSG